MTLSDQAPLAPVEAESPFLPGTLRQWALDSTSLNLLMTCPRKYYLSQILGLRRKRTRATITFGQGFHKALEVYEQQRAGSSTVVDETALTAAQFAAEQVTASHGGMDEHKSRTPESLRRSIDAYIRHHANEALETIITTDGTPAVELNFRQLIGYAPGIGDVTYCGYIDRIVRFQGVPYVLDHKTTGQSISTEKGSSAYFGSFTPDTQFTGYSWGAHASFGFPVRGVILDAMQVAKTKTEFARGIIHRTEAQIDEWQDTAMRHVRQSVAYAEEAETLPEPDQARAYPMNLSACHGKFGACTFCGICGRDPSVRKNFLDTDFERKSWNPLSPRTEGTLEDDVGEVATD